MTEDVSECLRTLPRTIKIGAYDWSVVFDEGDEKHGQAEFEFHIIRLWPATLRSASHCVGVLLHECLHVVFDNEHLGKLKKGKEAREEQIVMGFEAGLVSLLRDNPAVLRWMMKGLR